MPGELMRVRITGGFAALLTAAGLLVAAPVGASPAACAPGNPLQPTAELFATDNTATITDPGDQRLRTRLEGFELAVGAITVQNVALPVGSTLVSGVFWSDDRQMATYERSRAFRLACVDAPDLERIADQVRILFQQESVLTFEPLPANNPDVDAFVAEIPGVDVRRFHDGLVGDQVARERLVGGSITEGNTLILVAELADLEVARNFVAGLGASWPSALRYGDREFVG
ncbi:hypothetical protein [Nocardia sp. XZ_19_385]|uniref:hypothetical protein n=1 Tax=Nocardia sp. XZ_19_385 TaxID=2769488 RepID=UPI001E50126C|nr:hypothetical protein [Nocardia sp. XZ_19_385]